MRKSARLERRIDIRVPNDTLDSSVFYGKDRSNNLRLVGFFGARGLPNGALFDDDSVVAVEGLEGIEVNSGPSKPLLKECATVTRSSRPAYFNIGTGERHKLFQIPAV